jgi:hypothetical protein
MVPRLQAGQTLENLFMKKHLTQNGHYGPGRVNFLMGLNHTVYI